MGPPLVLPECVSGSWLEAGQRENLISLQDDGVLPGRLLLPRQLEVKNPIIPHEEYITEEA